VSRIAQTGVEKWGAARQVRLCAEGADLHPLVGEANGDETVEDRLCVSALLILLPLHEIHHCALEVDVNLCRTEEVSDIFE
jgi:hypothetical protein